MNENTNQTANPTTQPKTAEQKRFNTINAADLLAQEFEPLQFAVEKILPHGLFILAGSGKIGKSWLALDICTAVSAGQNLWDFAAEQGDVLYLALEDKYPRLKERLEKIKAEGVDVSRLELSTASLGINSGMIEQTHTFMAEHPNTKLIIVDTLECIRDAEQDKSMYSCDYRDMTALRSITDKHNLTLLLIHHTRKMYDPDPLNTLSGSTGLVGSVDGVFVLEKAKRIGNKAKLTIANRDTESYCFKVEFDPDKCKWLFIGNDADETDAEKKTNEPFCLLVNSFLKEQWSGTATDLCDALNSLDGSCGATHLTVTKLLKSNADYLKNNFGIEQNTDGRTGKNRVITLIRYAVPDSDE